MIKVVDLFCGVGGLSYGFSHNDKFQVIAANEYDKDIATAYSMNHPKVKMIQGDIRNITEDQLNNLAEEGIDVVVGGPPCQSYSTLGKRQLDDRAYLFTEYCRVLSILKPRLFIFENVKGLLSMQKGTLIKTIEDEFNKIGYKIKCKLLDAANYGVPQHRERVIIVGQLMENTFEYPKETHGEGLLPYVTVSDALSDMPVLKSGQESSDYAFEPLNDYQAYLREHSTLLTENSVPKNGKHLVEIMEALPDGGSKDDLPVELRPKSGFGNTYAKMWWNKPAPTITRNFGTPSSSRCIHPRDSRALTTREGARLQSFPDDYKFYGSRQIKNLQIGNAVPPILSIKLAEQVEKVFNEEAD